MGDEGRTTPKKIALEGSGREVGTSIPTPSPGRAKRPQFRLEARASPKKLKLENEFKLRVLLPNATSVTVVTDEARMQSIEELVRLVRATASGQNSETSAREVKWGPSVWMEDRTGRKLDDEALTNLRPSAMKAGNLILILQDGHPDSCHADKTMWNVTPKPAMLHNPPHGYTVETALADHVDNALQAVWSNPKGCRRFVSVKLSSDNITIFDTGQGMDGSGEHGNCIENWGTVGGSTHRDVHHKGVGGEPPFLKPFLGKYGAGGVAAAFHLGGCVTVSSKTRNSRVVVFLILEKEALLEQHRIDPTERDWTTKGGFRKATKEEKEMSTHGSFTKVEITKLKSQYCLRESERQYWTVDNVRQLLKDIYYPYIQSEAGPSSKTIYPVDFEVNGVNLLEISNCKTAIFKLHTCNGDPFVFDIHLMLAPDVRESGPAEIRSHVVDEANARVTCQYYPNLKGRESLETVLQQIMELRPGCSETFETMDRVTIRWLGRLLPDVKLSILPLMEVNQKAEGKFKVRRQWAKRALAFIDTDAGFHPNQSKTELERDQPFVVALKRIGSENFAGTSASGVTVKFTRQGNEILAKDLTEAYMEWLKGMHARFDEEFIFLDDPVYIFSHPDAEKELGVLKKQVILFHKHAKYANVEWRVDKKSPLYVKLAKGANGLKSDLYATIEYIFHDGAEDEHGEVKFLCRAVEVDEADGCKIVRKDDSGLLQFELNKSHWFPAAILGNPSTKCLDAASWKKKLDEVLNKAPSYVEVLNEEDSKKLELCGIFPADKSKFEAGFTLPEEFTVVIRPRRGSGPSFKQGMIVAEAMNIIITATHCSCVGFCSITKSPASSGSSISTDDHARVVFKDTALFTCRNNVKGLYLIKTSSEANRCLLLQGTYMFHVALESDKYKDVRPALSSIYIVPSRVTSNWTLCDHSEDCMLVDHARTKPISIRLNEGFKGDIFVQKYDHYGNRQSFEKPMELDIEGFSLKGESLEMKTKIQCFIAKSAKGRYKLQVKSMVFTSGVLKRVEKTYQAVLRVRFTETQHAEISCKVLPGVLATARVIASIPSIPEGSMCFEDALQPGCIIKRLAIQGLDAYGNKVDTGQKMEVLLNGLEFQDNDGSEREVDEYGNLQLGGLLKVTSHYNSTGSVRIASGNGSSFFTISFKTVMRKLVATKVPTKSYVGRYLDGVCIKIIDDSGNIDASVDGYIHSITVDWLEGVTYPFTKGKCLLPRFQLPQKPGPWEGKASFSANTTLSVLLQVHLEFATACGLRPATRKTETLMVKCGIPFVFPFSAYDDQHQAAILTASMIEMITLKAEAKDISDDTDSGYRHCEVLCKKIIMSATGGTYEAHTVVSGPIGLYNITMSDPSFVLEGKVEAVCKLQHGKVMRLSTALSNGATGTLRPIRILEATRCSPMPGLTITLLDSYDNICMSSMGAKVILKVKDCPQWKDCTTEVSQGIGQFGSPLLIIPVGKYHVSIELDVLPDDSDCLNEQINPTAAHFTLMVQDGNYPSAMKFLRGDGITVSLTTEDIQYLPLTTVLVESADKKMLQSRPSVGVKLYGHNSLEFDPKEFFGTFVPTQASLLDGGEGEGEDQKFSTFEFSQVCVPAQVGEYVMEFFVLDSDVPTISRRLTVKHGPPMRVEIIQREPGKEMGNLRVNLCDDHANICGDISGLKLSLDLHLGRNFFMASTLGPCTVLGSSYTVVERGEGDFGEFELSKGIPGMYKLKVFAVGEHSSFNPQSIIPGEAEIFVTHGNISETIQRECQRTQVMAQANKEKLEAIKKGENIIQQKKVAISSLRNAIIKLTEELESQERYQNGIQASRQAMHDDQVLQTEQCQVLRTEQNVLQDIRCLAAQRGYSAALALLDAQSEGCFLSPHSSNPAALDVVGVVAMLARVENDDLNRVLSEFLALGTLLLIVAKTQLGVRALEEYDQHGVMNENKGLHGFAKSRGKRISGRFEVLALNDIRPFSRPDGQAVNMQHSQRILNIDPPSLPHGQVPIGFLGYAVNLLHLRSEQLNTKIHTRWGDVGLRETLFFHILGFLQVYDIRDNMIAAKERVKNFQGGAISLDGGVIRKNHRQQLGRCNDKLTVRFGTVPLHERMVVSLMPTTRLAFERLKKLNIIDGEIRSKQEALNGMQQRLNGEETALVHLEKTVGKTKTEQKRLIESCKLFANQFAELMRAQDAIVGRNTNGIVDTRHCSDSDKPRAFMM